MLSILIFLFQDFSSSESSSIACQLSRGLYCALRYAFSACVVALILLHFPLIDTLSLAFAAALAVFFAKQFMLPLQADFIVYRQVSFHSAP